MIPAARYPPPVRPGDRIGVAALSGRVDPDRLAAGLAALSSLGFEPVVAGNLLSRDGLFAGSDQERVQAFHELARDPSLKAIFFARGGHGLLRVLPLLDWELLRAHPRAYVGYSDLTPFLYQVVAQLGLVAFHGPMVAVELARGLSVEERRSLLEALVGGEGFGEVHGVAGLRGGQAEGVLLGGCLSLVVATLGTPWQMDLEGAIVFLEDVAEPPFRVDRMLTHLMLSGSLRGVAGMAVGPCPGEPSGGASVDWLQPLFDASQYHRGPLAWGFSSGHTEPNLTLPLGRPVRLVTTAGGASHMQFLEHLSSRES